MAIDHTTFADECVSQGAFLGVHPHYLMASAALRSGIKDDTDGDRIGPYRVQQTFWDANGSAVDLEVVLDPEDIKDWRLQVLFASVTAFRAQNRLLDQLGRFPSAIELYREQWLDKSDGIESGLQSTLNDTAEFIEKASKKLLGSAPEPPIMSKAGDQASPPPTDPKAPTAKKGEELFLLKAPRIMEKLIDDFDIKDFQAAGILGNIGLECDGFRLMQEVKPIGGGRGGFGWCQWTGDRRGLFEAFCKAEGLDPTSDAANYGYLHRELKDTEKASIKALRPTTNLVDAVHAFEHSFERAKAGFEHFDRRERWGKLALAHFNRQLPKAVTKLLDPDLLYKEVASAKSGGASFWVVEQFTENGGQFLIAQLAGQDAKIVARDTTIFPIAAELIPDPIPSAVAKSLSADIEAPGQPPKTPPVSLPASDEQAAALVLAKAEQCDETLITRNAPGTNQGRLACAWSVNEVVRQALGKPIGGGLSTVAMSKVLVAHHTKIQENRIAGGMIIMSPTQGSNVGHVGILGELKTPLSATTVFSNSSSRAVFSHKFTLASWNNFYGTRKNLPVLFFALQRQNLGK